MFEADVRFRPKADSGEFSKVTQIQSLRVDTSSHPSMKSFSQKSTVNKLHILDFVVNPLIQRKNFKIRKASLIINRANRHFRDKFVNGKS